MIRDFLLLTIGYAMGRVALSLYREWRQRRLVKRQRKAWGATDPVHILFHHTLGDLTREEVEAKLRDTQWNKDRQGYEAPGPAPWDGPIVVEPTRPEAPEGRPEPSP